MNRIKLSIVLNSEEIYFSLTLEQPPTGCDGK